MDPEVSDADLEALNKLVDDVEKLNQQLKRIEESMAESLRIQAAYKAPSMDEKLDRMIALLETMMPTPKSESELELCVPVETDMVSKGAVNAVEVDKDSSEPELDSKAAEFYFGAVKVDAMIESVVSASAEMDLASIDVTDKSDSAIATSVFEDGDLDVSTIDSTQAEVISVHSSSLIALSKKEIKNEKDGLEFGNTVCLQSWYSPQSLKYTPIDFKSVLVAKIDHKRHKGEESEFGTIMSKSLNICTEPVRRNVCEIFPIFLPPAKPPDDSSKVLSTEFYGNVTLDMPPYDVVEEIMCLEICFDRPKTCNLGDGDFLKLLLLKEQIVRPMLNIKVDIVVVMFVIDLTKCTLVGWCNANTVRHLKEMVDNTKLVRGFDKTLSHFVGIILRYINLAGEVGPEADIMKFNGGAGGNIASKKQHCIVINGEWKADVIVCGGTW